MSTELFWTVFSVANETADSWRALKVKYSDVWVSDPGVYRPDYKSDPVSIIFVLLLRELVRFSIELTRFVFDSRVTFSDHSSLAKYWFYSNKSVVLMPIIFFPQCTDLLAGYRLVRRSYLEFYCRLQSVASAADSHVRYNKVLANFRTSKYYVNESSSLANASSYIS